MSSQNEIGSSETPDPVAFANVPMTTLQAMYHAVTGKTENIGKSFVKNVRIIYDDTRVLHKKISQKLELYQLVAPPTVTITAKMHNKQAYQYSGWERFQMFEVATSDITSEIDLKYEFLLQLPGVQNPQRCVLNINIDSKFPVIKNNIEDEGDEDGFFFMAIDRMPTVTTRIEFVDFLVAKDFQQIVEEWFNHLPEVTSPSWAVKIARSGFGKIEAFTQLGVLGVAGFLFIVPYFYPKSVESIGEAFILISVASFMYILSRTLSQNISWAIRKHVQRVILPSLIVFTRGDEILARKMEDRGVSAKHKLLQIIGFVLVNLCINLVASVIYGRLSS